MHGEGRGREAHGEGRAEVCRLRLIEKGGLRMRVHSEEAKRCREERGGARRCREGRAKRCREGRV